MNYRIVFWMALVILLLSIGLLASGSSILTKPIISNSELLYGNLLAALGMCAIPTLLFSKIKSEKGPTNRLHQILLRLGQIGLFTALIWWPLGRYLSGNWRNSFQNIPERSALFWTLTFVLLGYFILIWVLYLLFSLSKKKPN